MKYDYWYSDKHYCYDIVYVFYSLMIYSVVDHWLHIFWPGGLFWGWIWSYCYLLFVVLIVFLVLHCCWWITPWGVFACSTFTGTFWIVVDDPVELMLFIVILVCYWCYSIPLLMRYGKAYRYIDWWWYCSVVVLDLLTCCWLLTLLLFHCSTLPVVILWNCVVVRWFDDW